MVAGGITDDVRQVNPDDFVNSPISALRFSALSLRRTGSTPHATRFARLELGLFTTPSIRVAFYEFINPIAAAG